MNDLATTEQKPLVILKEQLEQRSSELKMALPAHISPEKFQRTVITAVHQNAKLLDCSRTSLMLACMKAATDGLLPDGREAALIPFKTRKKGQNNQWYDHWEVVYMPMVYGLRKKVLQARDAKGEPVVSALEVGVVYRKEVEAGHFYYEVGKFPPLGHRPMLELTAEDTTDDKIVGAYSIATMADGTKSYEFMRRFEIDKVRECSQTGATKDRQGKPRQPSGPWVEWFPEQCKKTVLRRHSKSLPQSGDLIIEAEDDEAGLAAVALLDSAPGGEPTLITDNSEDQTIDSATGEIVEDSPADAGQPEGDDPPAEDEQGGQADVSDEDRAFAVRLIKDIWATRKASEARAVYFNAELELASLSRSAPALAEEIDAAYEAHHRALSDKEAKARPTAKQTEAAK